MPQEFLMCARHFASIGHVWAHVVGAWLYHLYGKTVLWGIFGWWHWLVLFSACNSDPGNSFRSEIEWMDQVPHHHLLFHLTDVETNANFRTAGAVLFPPCGSISWTSWWMEKPQPLIWIGWKLSCGRLKIKNLQMCPNMSPENTWKMSCVTFWLVQIDSWTVACWSAKNTKCLQFSGKILFLPTRKGGGRV